MQVVPVVYLLAVYMCAFPFTFACIESVPESVRFNGGSHFGSEHGIGYHVMLFIMHLTAGFMHLHRVLGSCHWRQHSKTFIGIVLMRMGSLLQPPGDHHPNSLECHWMTAQLSSLKKNTRMLWQSWNKYTGAIRRNKIMPGLSFWWNQHNFNGANGFWRKDHLWQK